MPLPGDEGYRYGAKKYANAGSGIRARAVRPVLEMERTFSGFQLKSRPGTIPIVPRTSGKFYVPTLGDNFFNKAVPVAKGFNKSPTGMVLKTLAELALEALLTQDEYDALNNTPPVRVAFGPGVEHLCGNGTSVVVTGNHANGQSCGNQDIPQKTPAKLKYFSAFDAWLAIGGQDNSWSFDPANYYDWRHTSGPGPDFEVEDKWRKIGAAAPVRDTPITYKGRALWLDPYQDPGPAPGPVYLRRFYPFGFNPEFYAPGFAPTPAHPPRWSQKWARRGAARISGFTYEASHDRLKSAVLVQPRMPTVTWGISPSGHGLPPKSGWTAHKLAPPPPGTREKKVRGLIAAGSPLARALSYTTESLDVLYCLYDALPSKFRRSNRGSGPGLMRSGSAAPRRSPGGATRTHRTIKRPPPHEAFGRILRGLGEMDFTDVGVCLVMNEIEDRIIGGLAGAAGKEFGQAAFKYGGGSRARSPLAGFGSFGGR